ncbi:MAG: hypothetical protein JSW11_16990 [Candidatus Heimdallarchaeota archaeon]|nr:MAG: hypothetical protein JSW11_16990 [Candidatus Heimdallarchaeota archaeon]
MRIDLEKLQEFENTIDTIQPERGKVPIKILGYGEISLVFELANDDQPIAYKRLPIFDSETQVNRHILAYDIYHQILQRLHLIVPAHDAIWVQSQKGNIVLYCAQEKIPVETVGHKILHHSISKKEIHTLILLIMREMHKIWAFSHRSKTLKVGLDGQISNWAVIGYNPQNPHISEDDQLIYLDTSTPMFRKQGIEAMEPILFLKSAPFFLRWLLKALFLKEVVDRYYDWRLVTIDLVANFFKEQRPELIPGVLKVINDFFSEEAVEFDIIPLTYEEVKKYYDEDKQIWVIFQNTRHLDRYIQTKLLRKQYDFYLPGMIQR